MNRTFIYICAAFMTAACTTTKTTTSVTTTATASVAADVTPVGDWNYLVTGTPDGDFKGVLVITSSAGTYSAKMVSGTGEVPVQKFIYIKESNKITGEVPYNEFMVGLDAKLAGDELKGSMSAGGMDFPFSATRKK